MTIKLQKYGTLRGEPLYEFTLTNQAGMAVHLLNYGATLARVVVPTAHGSLDQILTLPSVADYAKERNFLGGTVGRVVGRLPGHVWHRGDRDITLLAGEGENAIHGGPEGSDTQVFTMDCEKRYVECQGDAFVLATTNADGPPRAKVITLHNGCREHVIDLESEIVLCAYAHNAFVASTTDGRVLIWSLTSVQRPQVMIQHTEMRMIQPVDNPYQSTALFLLVHSRNSTIYFDEYGNKSPVIPQPVVNAKRVYYVPSGAFSVVVTEALDLITTWFTDV